MQKYKYIIILLIFFEPLIYGQNIGSTGFPVKSCLSYHEKTGLQF